MINGHRLIAIYNVYNGAKTIKKSIELILPFVDEVQVFDGAWKQFNDIDASSTDDTEKIVKSIDKKKVKFIKNKKLFDCQTEKRTHSLSKLKPGDYFLWMDDDEMIYDAEKLLDLPYGDFDTAWCWTISNIYDEPYMIPRVIRYIPGIHYDGRHWFILLPDKNLYVSHHEINKNFVNIDFDMRIWNLREKAKNNDKVYNSWVKSQWTIEEERARELKRNYFKFEDLEVHKIGHKVKPRHCSVIKKPDNPEYTLFVGFSRNWLAQKWFDRFNTIEFPASTELIMVFDSNDKKFFKAIETRLFKWTDKFNGIKLFFTDLKKIPEFATGHTGKDGESPRRARIIHNWHLALTEAQGNILLGAEDDTLPDDNDAYLKLIKHLETLPDCGYVQGIEVCRWQINPLWAFDIEEDEQGIKSISSLGFKKGVVEMTGGGWYLFAMPMDVAKKHKLYSINTPDIGPDLVQGLNIRRSGLKCYTDFDLKCSHIREDRVLHPDTWNKVCIYRRTRENNWEKEIIPISKDDLDNGDDYVI